MTKVPASTLHGPVSRLLEAEVREQVAKHNLVLWLDLDSHYVDVVNQFRSLRRQGELKYDVYTFNGSFLELLLELEDVMAGVDATRAVIHLPGFNEELVKATPLLELYGRVRGIARPSRHWFGMRPPARCVPIRSMSSCGAATCPCPERMCGCTICRQPAQKVWPAS